MIYTEFENTWKCEERRSTHASFYIFDEALYIQTILPSVVGKSSMWLSRDRVEISDALTTNIAVKDHLKKYRLLTENKALYNALQNKTFVGKILKETVSNSVEFPYIKGHPRMRVHVFPSYCVVTRQHYTFDKKEKSWGWWRGTDVFSERLYSFNEVNNYITKRFPKKTLKTKLYNKIMIDLEDCLTRNLDICKQKSQAILQSALKSQNLKELNTGKGDFVEMKTEHGSFVVVITQSSNINVPWAFVKIPKDFCSIYEHHSPFFGSKSIEGIREIFKHLLKNKRILKKLPEHLEGFLHVMKKIERKYYPFKM